MAWTTPSTFVAGDVLEAADLNEQVRDNMTYVHSGKPATAINHNNTTAYTPGTSFGDVDATNLSITLSLTTGRVEIKAHCAFLAATSDGTTMYLDVTVDGTRQGGTDGIAMDSTTDPAKKGVGFSLIVTGLSVGSHTFKLQAKQAYVATAGTIVSSAASFVHFSVHEL